MHDTARETGRAFFETYGPGKKSVLDVGSLDVNGTLKPYVSDEMNYCGVDISSGPNVNVVLDDPHRFPFVCEEFDLIVSTSCFEHDDMFWLTFAEMCRVVSVGGFIYISAPVAGVVHRHPIDAWRFYPDAGTALARWAERNLEPISLVESFIRPPGWEGWSDFVAVFAKRPFESPKRPLLSRFTDAMHIRC